MKPLYVLGISSFYHDSAAAIARDGEIMAAVQEERFSRKKNDSRFPKNAINYCLEAVEIEPYQLKAVVFYENPVLTLDRIFVTLLNSGKRGVDLWCRSAPGWLTTKLFVKDLVRTELQAEVPVLFSEHHLSHAASAFYPSPFDEAAVLVVDGVGEWATTSLGIANSDGIKIFKEIHFPHSLGLLYSTFTQFCGFKVNSGEYKLMGLAPYGKPVFIDLIRELISVKEDGSFQLNMKYFGYLDSQSMINEAFCQLFGGDPRKPESRITRREMDLAASIQQIIEEVLFKIVNYLKETTELPNLCLAGGVAQNCVANGKILKKNFFEKMWIQPAAGDAGGALGAALLATHQYFGLSRLKTNSHSDRQKGSYLGPSFTNGEIQAFLDYYDYPYKLVTDQERANLIAQALIEGKIIGYFVGRAEFGPRALGARSILGDARNTSMQSKMNLNIKFRESFRPFAPSVIKECCAKIFDLTVDSPYMLLVAPVREELRYPIIDIDDEDLIKIVNQKRSLIPAVTHVDYSARIQTVDEQDKPDYYQVIKEFENLTGVGVILNTSFNVRGEPIVCFPQEAYRCFMCTDMDLLVMENCLLFKEEQPVFEKSNYWREKYESD